MTEKVGGAGNLDCAIGGAAAAVGTAMAPTAAGAFGAGVSCASDQGGSGSGGSFEHLDRPWQYVCGA